VGARADIAERRCVRVERACPCIDGVQQRHTARGSASQVVVDWHRIGGGRRHLGNRRDRLRRGGLPGPVTGAARQAGNTGGVNFRIAKRTHHGRRFVQIELRDIAAPGIGIGCRRGGEQAARAAQQRFAGGELALQISGDMRRILIKAAVGSAQ